MKILCTVKFVPDVDKFKFDFENNTVVRENVRTIINPEDSNAVAFALKMKTKYPGTVVDVVTMGPKSIMPLVEDLVRVGVDKVHMISDKRYSGSDSYATSVILGTYIKKQSFDWIITGTHAIDGDTSHVPSQLAEFLGINQMSNVIKIDEDDFDLNSAIITVDDEERILTYEMSKPGIISVNKSSKYKMPYIKYEDLNRDVKEQIIIVTNDYLALEDSEIGLNGSLTKVNRTFIKEYELRDKVVVSNDEEGIEKVYDFLKNHGYLENTKKGV